MELCRVIPHPGGVFDRFEPCHARPLLGKGHCHVIDPGGGGVLDPCLGIGVPLRV